MNNDVKYIGNSTFLSSGRNIHRETLMEKISALEAHKTIRTARELSDAIIETFTSQGIIIKPSFLFGRTHMLAFEENPEEAFEVLTMPFNKIMTRYYLGKPHKRIDVESAPAYTMARAYPDLLLGKINPSEIRIVYVNITGEK